MKTILIIEFDDDMLENLMEYFELLDYKVLIANDAKKGLKDIKKKTPELILCEFKNTEMRKCPNMTLLASTANKNGIPIICTGTMEESTFIKNAFQFNIDTYIIKPFSLITLLNAVEKTLQLT